VVDRILETAKKAASVLTEAEIRAVIGPVR
jgi:hypothetical protein